MMFSTKEKQHIASVIEKTLLKLKHSEMPTERPVFKLHVEGAEDWSWADIVPNWRYGRIEMKSFIFRTEVKIVAESEDDAQMEIIDIMDDHDILWEVEEIEQCEVKNEKPTDRD